MIKNYLLDTNIVLSDQNALLGFADNNVYISGTTLQEIDKYKTAPGEIGFMAREFCRKMDSLRLSGDLLSGITLENGGKLFVEIHTCPEDLPDGYSMDVPDNRIIATGMYLSKSCSIPVVLVSNDISMRINASICGLAVEEYRNDHIVEKEEIYSGITEIDDFDIELINELYKEKFIKYTDRKILPNQFVILKNGQHSALAIYRDKCLKLIQDEKVYGKIKALNSAQRFALNALMAPPEEIPLVILAGPAGTAKTFLSLAAGLTNTRLDYCDDGKYNRILISRPNVESDESFGYLPGDIYEKTLPLLSSYYDNLDTILRNGQKDEDKAQIKMQIDDLFDSGVIQICPLSHIRGRSLNYTYLICDEAQNASKSLIRDVITRAGRGTKIVVCGDLNQIDNSKLDKHNNGLIFALDRMKKSSLCASVVFTDECCVRSPLAKDAIDRLN